MYNLQLIAGLDAKFLMEMYYLPAIGILLLASVVFLTKKPKGHPYVLGVILLTALPLYFWFYLPVLFAPIGWYIYDKFVTKSVDRSQALLLAGVTVVVGILAIAKSSLIPEENLPIIMMALLATIVSIFFTVVAVLQRNKVTP
jgi:hypothetical protein